MKIIISYIIFALLRKENNTHIVSIATLIGNQQLHWMSIYLKNHIKSLSICRENKISEHFFYNNRKLAHIQYTRMHIAKLEFAKFCSHSRPSAVRLPTNHGFLRLFSTVKLRKYSSKPLTRLAWGWTDKVPSTSGSLPLLTNPLALQPSLPIQEKAPVALHRLTALITPATSWSEPKIMQPTMTIQELEELRENFIYKRCAFLSYYLYYRGNFRHSVLFYRGKVIFPKAKGLELLLKKMPMKCLAPRRRFLWESRLYRIR